jgi:hypothetical protein
MDKELKEKLNSVKHPDVFEWYAIPDTITPDIC